MQPSLTDWIQALATVAALSTAIAAVLVAYRTPKLAAKFAEASRREGAKLEERERLRTSILVLLLNGRRQILHPDTVRALNVVDFVFHDDPEVRSAYKLFIDATINHSPEKIVERYQTLTISVVKSLGYSDSITESDMLLGYYPTALGRLDQAALAEAEKKISDSLKVEI